MFPSPHNPDSRAMNEHEVENPGEDNGGLFSNTPKSTSAGMGRRKGCVRIYPAMVS